MNKYIANIVSKTNSNYGDIFNVVDDLSKIDKRFPTLIIGWDDAVSLFPDISILHWKINDDLFWTHRKNVKRTSYEEDLKRFKELSLKRLDSMVKYKSFNLMTSSREKIARMLSFISSDNGKYCFMSDKEAYIYDSQSHMVIGLSKDEADYSGIGSDMSKMTIKGNIKNIVYNDYDIPWDIKNRIGKKRYMVPFLISLFNE